jgi:molybdopterin converting factor small subunit
LSVNEREGITVAVSLLPPLSNTAGRDRVTLDLNAGATVRTVIDALVARFDNPEFRLHLYDTEGRLIPAWRAFINNQAPVRIATREGGAAPVSDGDEITFLLSLAGG